MKLPTQKTAPVFDVSSQSVLVYGRPKIGKSTFCSKADMALFLATEPGLNSLDAYQVPIVNWPEFLEACAEVAKGGHAFKTVVLDTVDNAYQYCADFVCEKWKIKHPSDLAYGKGQGLVNQEFHRALTKLAALPYGLMLTSHAVDREMESSTGKFMKTTPTLPEGARKILLGFVDIILYADVEMATDAAGNTVYNRVLRTKPNKHYEAGDRTGRLPATLPMDFGAFIGALAVDAPEFENGIKIRGSETKPVAATKPVVKQTARVEPAATVAPVTPPTVAPPAVVEATDKHPPVEAYADDVAREQSQATDSTTTETAGSDAQAAMATDPAPAIPHVEGPTLAPGDEHVEKLVGVEEIKAIRALLKKNAVDEVAVLTGYQIARLEDLPLKKYTGCMGRLQKSGKGATKTTAGVGAVMGAK